ncbi:MAG TPA: type ISP restriction/modification enzyme, partial [Candidatus Udaeobacter sp.]|nr:type ISP restriction/modification enzyme [Candidatus Udaeobacter sp.]
MLGFITNHTYFDGVTHRRLRKSLLESFQSLRLMDLHGSVKKSERCPDGTPDKNVFDIQQGVAIGIFRRAPDGGTQVFHANLWGTRDVKYWWLKSHSIVDTTWQIVEPTEDRFYFVPHNLASDSDYNNFVSIRDAFLETATGFETARDHFAISFSDQDLRTRMEDLVGSESDEVIRSRWGLDDKRDWNLSTARARLRKLANPLAAIRSCCYRPFDNRITHYDDLIVTWPRIKVLGCIDATNPALVAARMVKGEDHNHFFVVNQPTEKIFISGKTSNNAFVFPLYQREASVAFIGSKLGGEVPEQKLNFRGDFLARFRSQLALAETAYDVDSFARDIFHY